MKRLSSENGELMKKVCTFLTIKFEEKRDVNTVNDIVWKNDGGLMSKSIANKLYNCRRFKLTQHRKL
jgi:hypothetical protein